MIENEQRYRASAYSLLAALLRAAPEKPLLEHVASMSPGGEAGGDALAVAMTRLADAAREQDLVRLEAEYNALFIGLGKGEIVPYGSWYLTGFLMEQPLSDLRDDLARLGFERRAETREPEDHICAIFEVISVMIADTFSLSEQRHFFERHLQPWGLKFFEDLGKARSAEFYQPVAQFGAAFIELEQNYLSIRS